MARGWPGASWAVAGGYKGGWTVSQQGKAVARRSRGGCDGPACGDYWGKVVTGHLRAFRPGRPHAPLQPVHTDSVAGYMFLFFSGPRWLAHRSHAYLPSRERCSSAVGPLQAQCHVPPRIGAGKPKYVGWLSPPIPSLPAGQKRPSVPSPRRRRPRHREHNPGIRRRLPPSPRRDRNAVNRKPIHPPRQRRHHPRGRVGRPAVLGSVTACNG